ncbi:MAG: OmpP1/FadL family transporter, partial [Spirochaetota bacterium]
MKKTLILTMIMYCGSLFAEGLSTSNFNYMNDMVGGRASGMGGAYTAISDDPAGLYYNPAGSVFAPDNQLSLSVNSYKQKQSRFKKVIGKDDYVQDVSSFYPSFFGVVQSFGNIKIGFSFVNLNNEILDQDSYFNDLTISDNPATFTMNYNITENTLLAGPSISTFITDTVSVGATLYGLRRSRQEISFQMVTAETDSGNELYEINNIYITEEMYGVRPVIGVQFMPNQYISIGASAMLGFIFSHERDVQRFYKEFEGGQVLGQTNTDGEETSGTARSSVSYNDSTVPTIFRTGIAWYPSKKLIVSADI